MTNSRTPLSERSEAQQSLQIDGQDKRIHLTFVATAHHLNEDQEKRKSCDKPAVIYSQFRVMQILASMDAAILCEGLGSDQTAETNDLGTSKLLKRIFPEHVDIRSMDFNKLSETQKAILALNNGVSILLYLEKISCVYRTEKYLYDPQEEKRILNSFSLSFSGIIKKYPELKEIHDKCGKDLLFDELVPPEHMLRYQQYSEEISKANPKLYNDRERQALDCALEAARKSGKREVVLPMGLSHSLGITKLIDNEYKDRIKLVRVIQTLEGYPHPQKLEQIRDCQRKAAAEYKSANYSQAQKYYHYALSFWKATPSSTHDREDNIRASEYNLGSTLFKLAETSENACYGDSLPHLEEASRLCNTTGVNKYRSRFLEGMKRNEIATTFNEEGSLNLKMRNLIFEYTGLEGEESAPATVMGLKK